MPKSYVLPSDAEVREFICSAMGDQFAPDHSSEETDAIIPDIRKFVRKYIRINCQGACRPERGRTREH